MSRAKWKGPFIKTMYNTKKHYEFLKMSRNSEITPNHVDKIFTIHNGKKYLNLIINNHMIYHKFGEFFFTRNHTTLKKNTKWAKKPTR